MTGVLLAMPGDAFDQLLQRIAAPAQTRQRWKKRVPIRGEHVADDAQTLDQARQTALLQQGACQLAGHRRSLLLVDRIVPANVVTRRQSNAPRVTGLDISPISACRIPSSLRTSLTAGCAALMGCLPRVEWSCSPLKTPLSG
nr:hypothetical protein [Bordetella sp. FB-8]